MPWAASLQSPWGLCLDLVLSGPGGPLGVLVHRRSWLHGRGRDAGRPRIPAKRPIQALGPRAQALGIAAPREGARRCNDAANSR